MGRASSTALLGLLAAGCTMGNPAFELGLAAEEATGEAGADSGGSGDGDSGDGDSGDGDSGDGDSGDGDGTSSGDGDGTSSGDGDGDGTSSGDGDGTSSGDGDGDGTSSGDGDGDGTSSGDGDGDGTSSGDGDGDGTSSGDGDGDGTSSGDGDGDGTSSGDGDGTTTGDGDGDGTTTGDGDGAPGDGDGAPGDGDGTTFGDGDGTTFGDGDGTPGDGDGTTFGDGDGTTFGDGDGDGTTFGDGDGDGTTFGDGDGTTFGDGDGTTSGDGDGSTGGPVCPNCQANEYCDNGTCVAARRIIYLNFEGGTFQYSSTASDPTMNIQKASPSLPSVIEPYDGTDAASILADLQADFAPLLPTASAPAPNGMIITDVRPATGPYHMLVATATDIGMNVVGNGEPNCGGALDTTIYFSFVRVGGPLNPVMRSNAIGAGMGELLGLERVAPDTDLMHFFVPTTDVTFTDACLAEEPTRPFQCTSAHIQHCGPNQQNAIAELRAGADLP